MHLSSSQLEAYRQQQLAPTELIALNDHLAACAACRQQLEAALPTTAMAFYSDWQDGAAAAHLSFAQLAAYVDETLIGDARQFSADHLAACARCAAAVADLRTFKAEAVALPQTVAEPIGINWWDKARALFWPSAPAPAFRLACAALLLILAGWWLRRAIEPQALESRMAHQSPTPAATPPPASPHAPEPVPLLAQLNDGGETVTLDQQGKLTGLTALSPAHQQLVKAALAAPRLARPAALADLNRRGSSLMGADEQGHRFALRAPTGKVVLASRPTFTWTPLAEAKSYVVEIYDERFTLIMKSEALQRPAWTPPQPLARSRLYLWQVKASKDGQEVIAPQPPAEQARFRVVSQAQAADIARARRAYGDSHLTLGLLYARAGLLDEAETEFRALQKANPTSALARQWLAQVRAMKS